MDELKSSKRIQKVKRPLIKMKALQFLASISLFLFFSCKNLDTDTHVEQTQMDFPVLKSKDFNHILHLEVVKRDSMAPTRLKKIFIDLEGTTDLDNIASIAVYHTSEKKFIDDASILFSETDEISSYIALAGDMELKEQRNHFWLSYRLKDNANILDHVVGRCDKVLTERGEAVLGTLSEPKKLRLGVAVRKHNDDHVDTYRIPGLVSTDKGSLLGVYDIRRESSRDLQGDIDIGISRSIDGGNSWEPMRIALDMGEWGGLPQKFNGVSDASLLVDKNQGTVFVAGLWMHGVITKEGKWVENLTNDSTAWNHQWRDKGSQPGFGIKETSQFLIARSSDDGKTWEEPINLTKMCKKEEWWLWAPAPGNGITLDDGTLVLPTQGRDKDGLPFSNITYSKDGGKTWSTSTPAYTNTTECAVAQLDNGSLMLNMRDNRNRREKGKKNGRAVATTNNLGNTWTEHSTSHGALNEPVCMASLYKHEYKADGEKKSILFFSNPNTKEGRYNMTIKASLDNGKTWPEKYWLLLDEGYGRGYSSITSVDNNTIGILYEGSQADMTFQKIPIKDILANFPDQLNTQ